MGVAAKDPKRCTGCKQHKPRSEFYATAHSPNGVHAKCKECEKPYHRKVRIRSPEARKANLASLRRGALRRNYGITPEQYDDMLVDQDGCCALCRTDKPGGRGSFHVDHCHRTGVVRGLLCHRCNVGLGHFNDDVDLLLSACEYLEQNQ